MVKHFAALIVALLVARPVTAQTPPPPPVVGSVAPVINTVDIDGKAVRIGVAPGKRATVVEFWATWCELCKALMPEMRAAQKTYGAQVDFYGVNVTVNDGKDRVRRYVTTSLPPFTTVYDDRGLVVRAFGAVATSYVVIIDRTGKVTYTGDGGDQKISAELAKLVGK